MNPEELILWVVVLLFGPAVGAVVIVVLQPVLRNARGVVERFALPLAGALAAMEEGLASAEKTTRSLIVSSGRSFVREGTREVPNWPWRKVVKPLLNLVTFAYLALLDLYLAALAWSAMFGTGKVPNLHLSLPLLMGALWPGLAVAWAEALVDVAGPHPIAPYASLKGKMRSFVVGAAVVGLTTAFLGNIAFFVWRQGQLGLHANPFAGLAYPIAASIGALMFGALATTALAGLPLLAGVVPLMLCVVDLALMSLRGLVGGARIGLDLSARAAEFLLESAIVLSRQLNRLLAAIVGSISDWVEARRARAAARAVAQAEAARAAARVAAVRAKADLVAARAAAEAASARAAAELAAAHADAELKAARAAAVEALAPSFRQQLGIAVVDATHAFWELAGVFLRGVGVGVAAACRFAVTLIRDGSRSTAAVVVLMLKAVAAVALWLFYLAPRFAWTLWNWICRFVFARRLHFEPLPDPPPKARMQDRLAKLDLDLFPRRALVVPLRGTEAPAVAEAANVSRRSS